MSKTSCGLCGRDPSAGFASINGTFYCHGDDDPEPTCYMRAGFYLDTLGRDIPREAAVFAAICEDDSENEPPDVRTPGDDFGS